jgi:hypothetical protein
MFREADLGKDPHMARSCTPLHNFCAFVVTLGSELQVNGYIEYFCGFVIAAMHTAVSQLN